MQPGDSWLGYDRTFRLRAMSQPDLKWSCVDPMLWSLAFSGKRKVNRCRHCFSLTHSSSECKWSPGSQTSSTSSSPILGTFLKPSEGFQLFVMLGTTLQPYPNCKYEHKCTICTREVGTTDVLHKAIHCPHRLDHSSTIPTPQRTPQTYQRGPPSH